MPPTLPPTPPLAPLPPGLVAVTGGEGSGKTRLLHRIVTELPDALWLDLALPEEEARSATQFWQSLQARSPHWNKPLQQQLAQALQLQAHQDKPLYMLSTGSRRKVALVALLSCGAAVTCLDQPYAALDAASIRVLRAFLADMAEDASRSWVVADYEADALLPWQQIITLD